MAIFGAGKTSSSSSSEIRDPEKNQYDLKHRESPITDEGHLVSEEDPDKSLQRGLSSRQISMIAIGKLHTTIFAQSVQS